MYKNLQVLLPYLAIPEQDWNQLQIEMLIYDAVNDMSVRHNLEQRVCLLEIQDHKANIPLGLKRVEVVSRFVNTSELTTSELCDACPSCCTPVNDQGLVTENPIVSQCEDCQYPDVVQTTAQQVVAILPMLPAFFVTSNFHRKYFEIMSPRFTPYNAQLHCKDCPNFVNNCKETYEITPQNQIITSFKNGVICMSYLTLPTDDAGDLILYDHPDYLKAIANYVMYKFLEFQYNMRVDGAKDFYKEYQQRYYVTKRAGIGALTSKQIDYDTMRLLSFGRIKDILRLQFK